MGFHRFPATYATGHFAFRPITPHTFSALSPKINKCPLEPDPAVSHAAGAAHFAVCRFAASHATGFIGRRTFQPPAARITTATRLAGRRAFGTGYTITGRAEFRISCKPVAQT